MGRAALSFPGKTAPAESDRLRLAQEFDPASFAAWGLPPRGPRAELRSMQYQAAQRFTTTPPPNLASAILALKSRYPKSSVPSWAASGKIDKELLNQAIQWQADNGVVKDSNPGIPYKIFGPTNHSVLTQQGAFIAECVRARIALLADATIGELRGLSAFELAEKGFCDPVRVFVKNEPHSLEKMKQGRYRIISSVSLVDNIVQRCIFDQQDRLEISTWTHHPSQPGLGFTKDMTRKFLSQLPLGPVAEADVSGWDWSVQGWELEAEAIMRALLLDNPNEFFVGLLEKAMYVLSMSLFSLSDGSLYSQLEPGIMKSGAKITSSSNSRIRVLAHHILNPTNSWCLAMGDDSLESDFHGAKEAYLSLGHPTKMFSKKEDEFEFCGHIYDRKALTCRPVNVVKMMVRYCALSSPNEDQRSALLFETANALPSEKEWISSVLRHLGEAVPNATQEE